MKRLTLVRHAKSSWDHPGLADFDRPLNARGERDAPEMARRLAHRDVQPDRIVASPAIRAATTARILADGLKFSQNAIVLEPKLYNASTDELLGTLRNQPEPDLQVMLVAHNPGLTELGNLLGETVTIDNLPTCGVLCLDFDIGAWSDLEPHLGQLVFYDFPKNR